MYPTVCILLYVAISHYTSLHEYSSVFHIASPTHSPYIKRNLKNYYVHFFVHVSKPAHESHGHPVNSLC